MDLSNLCYRFFHIYGPEGFAAGFVRWVAMARQQFPRRQHVYALEGDGTKIRQKKLPCYKAQREHHVEASQAVLTAQALLHSIDCLLITAQRGEADDAIASFCHALPQPRDAVIVSRDRDLWQLVDQGIVIQSGQKGDPKIVDRFCCRRVMGVDPDAVALYKALQGDKSDNIPRVIPKVKKQRLQELASQAKTAAGFRQLAQPDVASYCDSVDLHYSITKLQDTLPLRKVQGRYSPEDLKSAVKSLSLAECKQAARGL